MDLLARSPERADVEVCTFCHRQVQDADHATGPCQNHETGWVEYVRADLHRGAVEERDRLRRLVLRDHAQGHKAHADCPACQKFGSLPAPRGGQ